MLRTRVLGCTGIEVSELGVGGYLGLLTDPQATPAQGEAAAVAAVRRAVDLGVRYFDTSPAYGGGAAERHLGLGLAALDAATRATLTVSTKVGTHPERPNAYRADDVRWCLARSAALLGRIDVVFVHDPTSDAHMDVITGAGGAFEALAAMRDAEQIRAFGLGVRNHRFLRRAIAWGVDVILPSYDWHPIRWSLEALLDEATRAGVAVVNGSPYQAGLLAGIDLTEAARRRPPGDGDLARARQVYAWCAERGVDVGAVAVQFGLREPRIGATLVGPRTVDEVESGVRHATTALPAALWEELDGFLQTLAPPPGPGGAARGVALPLAHKVLLGTSSIRARGRRNARFRSRPDLLRTCYGKRALLQSHEAPRHTTTAPQRQRRLHRSLDTWARLLLQHGLWGKGQG